MGFLGLGEPSLGTFIIFLGAWINRDTTYNPAGSWLKWRTSAAEGWSQDVCNEKALNQLTIHGRSISRSPSPSPCRQSLWRQRELRFLGFTKVIETPNTAPFHDTLPSRILHKFPFIMEIIYWGLIYSVYQMARAMLAKTLKSNTVDVARAHALQIIWLEQHLHIYHELGVQKFFLQYPDVMYWINRIYSFVHLPATITFLVGLYWFSVTRNRHLPVWLDLSSGPALYEARRRTLAVCNLLAFVVFSTWPCMPPRLLGNKQATGESEAVFADYDFVDTVHQYKSGAVSIFNQKKWTNQLAAMPSMHFGYALMIGFSIATLPLAGDRHSSRLFSTRKISPLRMTLVILGFLYPFTILTAIVATANHFILDAVAGSLVVVLAWKINGIMLNGRVIEDYVFWVLRTHKPVPGEDDFDRDVGLLDSPRSGSSRSSSGRQSPP